MPLRCDFVSFKSTMCGDASLIDTDMQDGILMEWLDVANARRTKTNWTIAEYRERGQEASIVQKSMQSDHVPPLPTHEGVSGRGGKTPRFLKTHQDFSSQDYG
jgi:hypothetical protein